MRNGKRLLSLLLIALLMLGVLPAAAHADPPKGDTHVHDWSLISDTATCTADGVKTWKCSLCNQTYSEPSPAKGHNWDNGSYTVEPSCVADGVMTYTCTRCGATRTETIPRKGHQNAPLKAKDPTCTEPGLAEGRICSVCGAILRSQDEIPPLGHTWSEWATLKEATCTEAGAETHTCIVCGVEETRTVDPKGHQPETLPGKAATCTEAGLTEGQRCLVCGAVLKAQQALPATGHSWDEGQVTREPSGFTPGVRTFTCKNDPGHTRTEEIDPAPWLFATFTGSIPDFTTFEASTHDLTPLTITEQPTGGSLTRDTDETVHLTCAATGGTGDYTYEWYSKKSVKVWGLNWPSYYGKQTEPGIDASTAGRKYWCVVTDSAGETAATDLAEVTYKIRIDKQPDNANLQPTGKATLSCEAADGSGSYSYRWIDNQDNEIDVGSSIDVTEIGDYMCIATDDQTGETASSYVATVYDTEPFRLMTFTGDGEHHPDGSGMLKAGFAGGVQPYEIWWDKDGEAIESEDAEVDDYIGAVVYNATIGNYTVHAVDAMGEVITATSHRTAPKLTIVRQPEGGIIPKDGYLPVSVTVSDGEGPYTYTLFKNGGLYGEITKDGTDGSFTVWYSGEYYLHIEDSKGRTADSDVVTFEDAVFRIKKQSNAGVLNTATDKAKLSVEVEGGKEPYTYTWIVRNNGLGFKTGTDSPTFFADAPGVYACRITDATGETIRTKDIHVLYNGQKPRILKQPSGLTLTPDEKGHFSFSLSCEAASGNGDESCLEYRWERYNPDGYWSYAGSEKTMTHSLLGSYRCKVIDVISKEYTYTQTVTVAEALTASVNAHSIPNSSYAAYYLNITGGTAPYTVKIYVVYAAYHADTGFVPSKTVLWKTYMVNTEEEAKDFYREVPHTYSYPYYEDGQWKYGWNYLKSYAIITDAGDRTTRVDIR
ncbi:MAG: hypothetical protein IJI85_03720 [Clostridia bacterium]|nr:hypothetical protein [Clostridia bacterium]